MGNQIPDWKFEGPISSNGGYVGSIKFIAIDKPVTVESGYCLSKAEVRVELSKAGLRATLHYVPQSLQAMRDRLATVTREIRYAQNRAKFYASVPPEVLKSGLKTSVILDELSKLPSQANKALNSHWEDFPDEARGTPPLALDQRSLAGRIELVHAYVAKLKVGNRTAESLALYPGSGLNPLEIMMYGIISEMESKMKV